MTRLLLLSLVVFACEHDTKQLACKDDRDCPRIAEGATCSYSCVEDQCRLVVLESHAGAGPCFGEKRDATSVLKLAPAPVLIQCDVNAGVFCDRALQRCAAVKPRGAVCKTDIECGDDGRCANGTCIAALAATENCHEAACARGLFCNANDRCEPRHDLGVACDLDDDCASLNCGRGHHCAAPHPQIACPIAH